MSDHLPECPIRRETWCIWPGDKCMKCAELRSGGASHDGMIRRGDVITAIRGES